MGPIKAGVIGLGVGEQHIRSYQNIPGCEVLAVCDRDADRLGDIADQYEIPTRQTDWRYLTEHPDLDVISVCSYDDGHAEQMISAFKHGKHVMVEKPAFLDKREAERVQGALIDNDRVLSSNLILRKSPRFQAIKRLIDDDAFGEIVHIEGDYLHDILWKITDGWRGRMKFYCTFYGGGVHLIDLMRWLISQEVDEVCGFGNDILTRDSSYRFPDTISALLKFRSGATGKSTTMFGPKRTKFHSLNVFGTKLTFINDSPDAKLFSGDRPEDEQPFSVPYPAIEKGDLLPEFIDAIREGREPLVSKVDVFRTMDVCFAIWEAVSSGRNVPVTYLM